MKTISKFLMVLILWIGIQSTGYSQFSKRAEYDTAINGLNYRYLSHDNFHYYLNGTKWIFTPNQLTINYNRSVITKTNYDGEIIASIQGDLEGYGVYETEPYWYGTDTFLYLNAGTPLSHLPWSELSVLKIGAKSNGSPSFGSFQWGYHYYPNYITYSAGARRQRAWKYDLWSSTPGMVAGYFYDGYFEDTNQQRQTGKYLELAKLELDGDIAFYRMLETGDFQKAVIEKASDGNYFVLYANVDEFNVLKIHATSGATIWHKRIVTSGKNYNPQSLCVNNNGDLLITALHLTNSQWFVKLDSTGAIQWQYELSTPLTGISLSQSQCKFIDSQWVIVSSEQGMSTNQFILVKDLGTSANFRTHWLNDYNAGFGLKEYGDFQHMLTNSGDKFAGVFTTYDVYGNALENSLMVLDSNFKLVACAFLPDTVLKSTTTHTISSYSIVNHKAPGHKDTNTVVFENIDWVDTIVCAICPHDSIYLGQNGACKGDSFYVVGDTANYSYYKWYENDSLIATTTYPWLKIPNDSVCFKVSAHYSEACYDTSLNKICIGRWPKAKFGNVGNCTGKDVCFLDSSIASAGLSKWKWYNQGLLFSQAQDTCIVYDSCSNQNVLLVVEDSLGCTDSFHNSVVIHKTPNSYFENTNNLNEFYKALCKSVVYHEFRTDLFQDLCGDSITNIRWFSSSTSYSVTSQGSPVTSFTFQDSGKRNIGLVLTSSSGCIDTTVKVYDVYRPKVTTHNYNVSCDGDTVHFNNTAYFPYGTFEVHNWRNTPGGNHNITSTGQYKWKFNGPKPHFMQYWVEDTMNCPSLSVKDSIIYYSRPTANFTFPNSICARSAFSFQDSSIAYGDSVVSWYWTFGDGTTSTVKNPTKFYTVSDYYYVKLIIVTSAGCRDTVTKTIFVKAAPPKPSLTLQPNKNHICVPELLKFYGTSGTGSVQSKWLLNNVNVLMNSDSLSWIFNDTVNQAHTVRYVLEDSNGCFSDSMITIFTHPLDTILLSKNNGYVCANSCDTLFGRLDTIYQSYEWEYSTDSLSWTSPMSNPGNAKEIVVCDTGYYRFKVYNGYGCSSYSRVIHVKFPPAFTMSSLSGDSTIVQGQTQLLQYMGSGFPNYQQYTWYRDGIPVLGPGSNLKTYGASKPGTYWLVATGQCGTERTNEIRVRHRAIDPQWDMTYISGFNFITSTTLSSVNGYRVGGDLIVNMGVTLTISSHVQFDSCTRIIVNNGGTLQLSNAVFSGNKFWRGIQCHSSGTINAVNSDIWDAVIAIEGTGFAKITIQNCNFGLNMVHVATRGTNSNISNITVLTSRFGHLYTGPDSLMGCYMAHDGIYVLPIKYRYISLNSGTTPVSVSQNKLYLNKLFPGHYFTGIYCDSTLAPGIIGNEVLGWFDTAMHLFSNNQGNYTNNTINNQGRWLFGYPANNYIYGTAMYTAQEKQANISSNRIERYRYGIEYYRLPVGGSEPLTRIKENRILDGIHGLVASYKANPLLTGSSVNRIYSSEIPVQISCNLFDNDSLNILGLGNVRDTVFGFKLSPVSFRSAGNKFSSTSYWGCFWEEINPKVTPKIYKFYNASGYPEDPQSGSVPNLAFDGLPGSYSVEGITQNLNSCVSVINRGYEPEIDESNSDWNLLVYPNPFEDAFTIQSDIAIKSYTIYNLKGEIIDEGNIAGLVKVTNRSEGLYIIRVINNSNETKTIKLMKVEH